MTIRPADVLLVEGARSKINSAIRYLTQSTWSHAALYVGLGANLGERDGEPLVLIEAELGKGVIASPLSKYQHLQHPHLPSGRADAGGPQRGHPLCDRAHRLRLRPEEHHRPDALFPAAAAGAGALAAAHDRARLRRADAGDLLDPDRAGLRSRSAIRSCRRCAGSMPRAAAKSCTSAIIRSTRRATSTSRRSSPSSSRRSRPDSITRR